MTNTTALNLESLNTSSKPPRHLLDWRGRAKAAGIHLSLSLLIAAITAALVFMLWFPWPFRIASGGEGLFLLIMSVDIVMGPLLTFAVFNRAKPRKELVRDLTIIVLLQLCALAYGLYTVFLARPVVLAFESDRLRAVTYVQVQHEQLKEAKPEFQQLSWTGPRLVGVRKSQGTELMKSVDESLQGVETSMRPGYWIPYADNKEQILKRARNIDLLRKQYPKQTAMIDEPISKAGKPENELRFLPLQARNTEWSVLIDASTALPLSYVQLEGFF